MFFDIETRWNHARFSTNTCRVTGSKIFINPCTEIDPVSLGRLAAGVAELDCVGCLFSLIHYLPWS